VSVRNNGFIILQWFSERYAIMCLALPYNIYFKNDWSISVIVGLKFLLCGT